MSKTIIDRLLNGENLTEDDLCQQYAKHANTIREVLPSIRSITSLSRASASTYIGKNIGGFTIRKEIGRGGMGVVYLARDESLDRDVALKLLPKAATLNVRSLMRFHIEAKSAAAVARPNIVPVHAFGEDEGVYFLAMQYIAGISIAELVNGLLTSQTISHSETAPTNLSPPHALLIQIDNLRQLGREYFLHVATLVRDVALALHHSHQQGIVHRDINPSNLLLDTSGKVWIFDFGLAMTEDHGLTLTGDLVGTLRYMSPEQAGGNREQLDHRIEIYSLGRVLYELLAMRPAFPAANRSEQIRLIDRKSPTKLRKIDRSVPVALEMIAFKAFSKSPTDRYATAKDLTEDLDALFGQRPIKARPLSSIGAVTHWCRRNPSLASALSVVSLLLLSISVIAPLVAAYQYPTAQQLETLNHDLINETTAKSKVHYLSEIKEADHAINDGRMQYAIKVLPH